VAAGYFDRMDPILASALTPLHPGAGRAPGVVDLPVQHDPYGYPLIPASSVKGALKTRAGRRRGCGQRSDGSFACGTIRRVDGREACEGPCCEVCCIFGPETREGDLGASAVSIVDFFLLAIPVPSLEYGYVYVTSPMLLARAKGILEAASLDGVFAELSRLVGTLLDRARGLRGRSVLSLGLEGEVTLGLERFTVERTLEADGLELGSLNPLYQARPLGQSLVVVGDDVAPMVVEKGLVRVTRVRLDRERKTVARGALWTEEYLPPGSLFIGAVAFTKPRNKYCRGTGIESAEDVKRRFLELLGAGGNGASVFYASIGGKETIGKGLMKLMIA